MKKRGISELISIILLILIVIIIIAFVLTFVLRGIGENEDIIRVQRELSRETLEIEDVDFKDDQNLTLTLKKGPGSQILMDISQEDRYYEYNITITNFSVEYIEHNETIIITNSTIVNVTNSTIVNVTNSTIIYVTNSTIVNGSQSDIVIVSDVSGSMAGSKITETKVATKDFIDSVFNQTENKLGLVAYTTTVQQSLGHPLANSSNITSLKAKVDSWSALMMTCICCGINEAINVLDDPSRNKVVALMSDGQANIQCIEQGTGSASQDAIEAARTAFEQYNITIHTVFYGAGMGQLTMQSIASAGNGSYYLAEVGNLSEIYSAISGNISWQDPVNISWQEPVNISLGEVEVNISWQDEVNISWQQEVNITWYEKNVVEYNETVTIKEYNASSVYSYLKVIFYTEDKTYQKLIPSSDIPPPHETREINLTVDSSWGITTDDLTKIEIYPVVMLESGQEIVSSEPISIWERPGFYSKRKQT